MKGAGLGILYELYNIILLIYDTNLVQNVNFNFDVFTMTVLSLIADFLKCLQLETFLN